MTPTAPSKPTKPSKPIGESTGADAADGPVAAQTQKGVCTPSGQKQVPLEQSTPPTGAQSASTPQVA